MNPPKSKLLGLERVCCPQLLLFSIIIIITKKERERERGFYSIWPLASRSSSQAARSTDKEKEG